MEIDFSKSKSFTCRSLSAIYTSDNLTPKELTLGARLAATNYETDYVETNTANAVHGGMVKVVEGEKGFAIRKPPALGGEAEAEGGARCILVCEHQQRTCFLRTYSWT